ncbi:OLC1v1013742C1 [Oldenlandia corymbosa var. corymbosa]|uniref:OLC1v1013742C1 n=1 Tax=Oldenlandia corymbosa var. corymbosa TaxID=529605 RepID=A0AAV1DZ95_OLDCO|nr:OLC1v1013742C1 [Oldenlandia corymbosa var. corymbosa]
MDVIKSQQMSGRPIEKVVVHPLVLLSIVDHYNRVARDTNKRVLGVLLGTSFRGTERGTVDVTNSYAVPFEEEDKDSSIWFLDHNYHEAMFSMFRRINAKEHVVGWYSTDVFNLLPNLNVSELIKSFAVKTNNQMLVIYLSSLIRSIIALHNLINNKMLNKEHENAEDLNQLLC